MTLCLLFERIEQRKIGLHTQLKVSENAASQAPTKLGLKAGQTIAVEDAIKAMVTKSADGAAVTVAENLGGDEGEFAKLMTDKAHALGMSHTTYVKNASAISFSPLNSLALGGDMLFADFDCIFGSFRGRLHVQSTPGCLGRFCAWS